MREWLTCQMGMEAPKSTETLFCDADPFQIGENDSPCVTHDHRINCASSIHEDADLPIDLAGKFGENPGKLLSDDGAGRDSPLINLFQAFALQSL